MKNTHKKPMDAEQKRLRLNEIEERMQAAETEAPTGLYLVKRDKLWEPGFANFDSYADIRWGYERSYASRLVAFGEFLESHPSNDYRLNEGSFRPLRNLSSQELELALSKIREMATAGAFITAKTTEELALAIRPKQTRETKMHRIDPATARADTAKFAAAIENPVSTLKEADKLEDISIGLSALLNLAEQVTTTVQKLFGTGDLAKARKALEQYTSSRCEPSEKPAHKNADPKSASNPGYGEPMSYDDIQELLNLPTDNPKR